MQILDYIAGIIILIVGFGLLYAKFYAFSLILILIALLQLIITYRRNRL